MINLSDHLCYHCRHMNRYQRTIHGQYVSAIESLQHQMYEKLEENNLNGLPYLRSKIEETEAAMRVFEKNPYTNHKYIEYNRHDASVA